MQSAPAEMADSATYADNTRVHSFSTAIDEEIVLPRFGKGMCTVTLNEYWAQRGGKPEARKGPPPTFWE